MPSTSRKIRATAREQSDRFESALLGNAVYDALLQDKLLERLIDVVSELDDLAYEVGLEDDLRDPLSTARYQLDDDDVVAMRTEQVVHRALEQVGEDLDTHSRAWSEDDVQDATHELREFWNDSDVHGDHGDTEVVDD